MHQRFIFIALFVCFQSFGFAQIQGQYDLKVDVDSVFLNLSVRERVNNHSLGGLRQSDFTIYEDGVRQEIQQFLPTEAPFNLLLLLDVSGSTSSYLKMMKQAAIEFTNSLNPEDRIAVATFNSKVRLVEDFTSNREMAEKAIKRIKSGGGTAFYDALMTSISQYMREVQGRTAIVVFTDGVDNQLEGMPESGSRTTFEELYRKVQEIDGIVYTIFLNTETEYRLTGYPGSMPGSPGWPGGFSSPFPFPFPSGRSIPRTHPVPVQSGDTVYRQAREQLQLIVDQTGGRMYSPNKIDELSGAYAEIADDLRIQYQVGYNSTNRVRDGSWRKIRVKVENKPDAIVRTRPGYYSRKEETVSSQ